MARYQIYDFIPCNHPIAQVEQGFFDLAIFAQGAKIAPHSG
jgi:hypothetical protein